MLLYVGAPSGVTRCHIALSNGCSPHLTLAAPQSLTAVQSFAPVVIPRITVLCSATLQKMVLGIFPRGPALWHLTCMKRFIFTLALLTQFIRDHMTFFAFILHYLFFLPYSMFFPLSKLAGEFPILVYTLSQFSVLLFIRIFSSCVLDISFLRVGLTSYRI